MMTQPPAADKETISAVMRKMGFTVSTIDPRGRFASFSLLT